MFTFSLMLLSFLAGIASVVGILVVKFELFKKISQLQIDVQRTKKDLRAACTATMGISQTISQMEKVVFSSRAQNNRLQKDGASFRHAEKMAALGSSIDEIMQNCGLTRAEAELISVVNQKNQ